MKKNSENNSSSSEFCGNFPHRLNEIVWTKIKGYPWWPAQIIEINEANKKIPYTINFFGEESHASVGPDCSGLGSGQRTQRGQDRHRSGAPGRLQCRRRRICSVHQEALRRTDRAQRAHGEAEHAPQGDGRFDFARRAVGSFDFVFGLASAARRAAARPILAHRLSSSPSSCAAVGKLQ